jgi:hypothetical protein
MYACRGNNSNILNVEHTYWTIPSQFCYPRTSPVTKTVCSLVNHQNPKKSAHLGNCKLPPAAEHILYRLARAILFQVRIPYPLHSKDRTQPPPVCWKIPEVQMVFTQWPPPYPVHSNGHCLLQPPHSVPAVEIQLHRAELHRQTQWVALYPLWWENYSHYSKATHMSGYATGLLLLELCITSSTKLKILRWMASINHNPVWPHQSSSHLFPSSLFWFLVLANQLSRCGYSLPTLLETKYPFS